MGKDDLLVWKAWGVGMIGAAPRTASGPQEEWTTGEIGENVYTQPFYNEEGLLVAIGLLVFDKNDTGGAVAASLLTPPRDIDESLPQAITNALLIAAAPDLLRACKAALREMPLNFSSRTKLKKALEKTKQPPSKQKKDV